MWGGRGREGSPIPRSDDSKLYLAAFLICHFTLLKGRYANEPVSICVLAGAGSKVLWYWFGSHPSWKSILASLLIITWHAVTLSSHLSAHVFHPGQSQLSEVSMLHSGAHQRHGDVPERRQRSREKMSDT